MVEQSDYKSNNHSSLGAGDQARNQLLEVEQALEELRIQYEQYFVGTLKRPPEKFHQSIQREIRNIVKLPFKGSALVYKARALTARYNTLNTYWKRVLRDRESGTYSKDVFKAEMREVHKNEDLRRETAVGKAEHSLKELYASYKEALEKATGHRTKLNFENFQRSITQRASEIKRISGAQALSFKVVVREGKVSVQIESR